MNSLSQILNYETLTGIVNDPRGGLPTENIPAPFFTVTQRVVGNTIKYYRVAGTRKTARVALRASASQRREMTGISEHSATALFVHEHMFHDVDVLGNLRAMDNPARQELGRQEVARQAKQTRDYLDNFRLAAVASALFRGKINYAIGSGLLGTGGTEIDFGVPAGNRDQLDVLGGGDILDGKWDAAATKIVDHITNLKNAALRKSGYPIKHAFYGANTLGHLLANNQVKELLKANQALSIAFSAREIPNGFLGLTWHAASDFFFEDDAGAIVNPIGVNQVVFSPDPSPEWWDVIEGSYEVPTNLGTVSATPEQAIGDFATVFGRFNYASITSDPSGIKHNYGDTFMPVIKVPNALFISDTVWS